MTSSKGDIIDRELDDERAQAAADEVRAWRSTGQMPFPEFPASRRDAVRDTLDYPPTGSPEAPPPLHDPSKPD